ncbi:MAG: glycosyltransferase family 4 protein [Cyclobacteriaceae bacterium]|nr:glycosyltransferase family 4 protein [Cyclobacteriaceae bacterium]
MLRDKIIFLTAKNPYSKNSWSGISFFMLQALQVTYEVDVIVLQSFRRIQLWGYYFSRLFHRITGSKYVFDYGVIMSWCYGRTASKRLRNKHGYRFILVPAGLPEVAYMKTTIPVVAVSDCSVLQLIDYYPSLKNVSNISKHELALVEAKALQKVSLAVFSSAWASDFTASRFSVNHTCVIPFGANLDKTFKAPQRNISKGRCRLLFTGIDWERKGGDTVLAVCHELHRQGVQVELTVVGSKPPATFILPQGINLQFISINKDEPDEEEWYFSILCTHDFLILPTLADCTPIVIAEAFWAGLPVLATYTGGIDSMIQPGITGYLFQAGEIQGYIDRINELLNAPDYYKSISTNCRSSAERVFNWKQWVKELDQEIQKAGI